MICTVLLLKPLQKKIELDLLGAKCISINFYFFFVDISFILVYGKRQNLSFTTENREQRTENREQRTENREQRTENREQRTENKEQRTKNKEQRTKKDANLNVTKSR